MPDWTKFIVPIFLAALLGAFLLPIAVNQMAAPEEMQVNQTVGETVELQPGLNTTLDSVDTTADSATYTVAAGGDSVTQTVDNGTNATVTVDGADVTISVTEVATGYAVADYSYPGDYGWGSGASALWAILPVMIVLALFLYFVRTAT